VAEGSGFEHQ